MRWRGAKLRSGWAAWLGVLALGLNALVPVHLAFDLTTALAPAHHPRAVSDESVRRVVAWLALHPEHPAAATATGHDHHDHAHRGSTGGEHHHHGAACPVCAALGSLAALSLAAPAAIAAPLTIAAPPAAPAPVAVAAIFYPAGYRSRAPPLSA